MDKMKLPQAVLDMWNQEAEMLKMNFEGKLDEASPANTLSTFSYILGRKAGYKRELDLTTMNNRLAELAKGFQAKLPQEAHGPDLNTFGVVLHNNFGQPEISRGVANDQAIERAKAARAANLEERGEDE